MSIQFIDGLKKEGYEYNDIKENYKYIGGNKGRHLNYFKLFKKEFPKSKDKCICGHFIIENCYISNGFNIIVLGNCCIKRFVPKCKRTCEKCGNIHKSIKTNICSDCKIAISNSNKLLKLFDDDLKLIQQEENDERNIFNNYWKILFNKELINELCKYCNIYDHKIIINDRYSIVIFDDFIINLKTMKPTKNSQKQYYFLDKYI